MGKRKTRNR